MTKTMLLKTPGFLFDLNFIFYLKFNMKLYLKNLLITDKKEETAKYFDDLSKQFGDVSDDLYVFYHAISNQRCFMSTHYLKPYKKNFTTTFDFKFLINELSDEGELIRRLIGFYFHDLSKIEIEGCIGSKEKLFAHIKKSDYSAEEKNALYEFFINPSPYIRQLRNELIDMEAKLSEYYRNHYEQILNAHNHVTFETICDRMYGLKDLTFLMENDQTLYISYSLINKYYIEEFTMSDGILYMLGNDYTTVLQPAIERKRTSDFETFGNALGDASRVKIFDYILKNHEVTCKDLEKAFDFSGSTSYHHLTLMTKARILVTRTEGKAVYYMINYKLMETMGKIFIDISKGQKGSII